MTEERIYPYRTAPWRGPVSIVVGILLSIYFWNLAKYVHGPILFLGAIHLSFTEARYLYWVMCALSGWIIFHLGILRTYISIKNDRSIRLAGDAIEVPKGVIKTLYARIPYTTIKGIRVVSLKGQRFLHIDHSQGRESIVGSMLLSRTAFDEICTFVAAKVNG
jgi:hypothetical protein